jgi:hypothetical protein
MRNAHTGLLIGAMFGMIFVLVNARGLPSAVALVLRGLAILAFVGLVIVVATGRGQAPPRPDGGGITFGRRYGLVVMAEVIAIVAGLSVLNQVLEAPEAGVAWIAVVVGVHFIALARVWRAMQIRWLGVALSVLGAAGLVLAALGASDDAIATVSGVGSGVVLLGGCWWSVLTSS